MKMSHSPRRATIPPLECAARIPRTIIGRRIPKSCGERTHLLMRTRRSGPKTGLALDRLITSQLLGGGNSNPTTITLQHSLPHDQEPPKETSDERNDDDEDGKSADDY